MHPLFAATVYTLCFLTSTLCAGLLGRHYLRSRARMLLWSSACFTLLAIVNLLVVLDLLVFPLLDMRLARTALSLLAVGVLLFGFIWDQEN